MSRGRFLKVLFCPLNDWAGFVSKSTVISFATENWKKERKTRKTKRRRREGGRKRGKEDGRMEGRKESKTDDQDNSAQQRVASQTNHF